MRQVLIISHHGDALWSDQLFFSHMGELPETKIKYFEYREGGPGVEALASDLEQSAVCLLLVSANFLASPLMGAQALPRLLSAGHRGLRVLWIPVSATAPYSRQALSQYEPVGDPLKPLDALTPQQAQRLLAKAAHRVREFLTSEAIVSSADGRAADAAPAPEAKRTFVCYARADESFVLRLASGLKEGGASLWLDQWDIPTSADWDYEIDKALYDCHYFLIVLSPAAVESEEVRSELRTALDEHKRIVPVLYRACRIPRRLRLLQHIDCTEAMLIPGEEAVRLLLDALGR